MLFNALQPAEIEAAFARLDQSDSTGARNGWEGLTAGEGAGVVTRETLEYYLWCLLPKRSIADVSDWRTEVEGLAKLFDAVGSSGSEYANICRSETTAAVFSAHEKSYEAGFEQGLKAIKSSPVHPPDMAGFTWASRFGMAEAAARSTVSLALEMALVDGTLDPVRSNFAAKRKMIAAKALDLETDAGQTHRTAVLTERADGWVRHRLGFGTEEDRRSWASQFIRRPEAPADAEAAQSFAALLWLLENLSGGATLTASGYLPSALVREAKGLLDPDWIGSPRSEADLPALSHLREMASKCRLIRKAGKKITTTKAGDAVLSDPGRSLDPVVRWLLDREPFVVEVTEFMLLHLRNGDVADPRVLGRELADHLDRTGWKIDDRSPSEARFQTFHYEMIRPWQTSGLLRYQSSRWAPNESGESIQIQSNELQLSPAGLAGAALWLHLRLGSAID